MAAKLNPRVMLSPTVLKHSKLLHIWLRQKPAAHEIRMSVERYRPGVLSTMMQACILPSPRRRRH
ncbi:hypothetical protein [Dyella psychrodurans]|nr:hypothetical protein [Dyella psychrodurans]